MMPEDHRDIETAEASPLEEWGSAGPPGARKQHGEMRVLL